jgi:GntR family transcriptional repressor for pyruvate dehydrogenase complex
LSIDANALKQSRQPRKNPPVAGLRPVKIVRSEPASSEVARALIDYIFSGQIEPGDKLPSERQLSESFGVGRSIVREGIKSLGLLGLVEFRHGGGTFMRGTNSELLTRAIEWGLMLGDRNLLDLVEARQHVEKITAGLAAERRTEDQLAAIEDAQATMSRATNATELVDADVAFHLAVADASGNHVLANMLRSISSLLRVWVHRVVESDNALPPTRNEHLPVYEAIRDRDVQAAQLAMESHLTAAAGRLRATLQQTSANGESPDASLEAEGQANERRPAPEEESA